MICVFLIAFCLFVLYADAMREYQLTEYENALSNFHIKCASDISRAQELHFHDYYQIYFIPKGSIMHRIGEETAELFAGDAAIIPPLTAHRIVESRNAMFYAVSFQATFLPREIADGTLGEFLHFIRNANRPQPRLVLPSGMSETVESLLKTMLTEFLSHEIAYVGVLQGLLPALLALFNRASHALPDYAGHAEGMEEKRRHILLCTERMKQDLTVHTTLEEEARRCLMSRAQFCKAFMEVTGTSFGKYRTRLRIDRAASLLREDNRSIEQIAASCGFLEYSSFYRSFVDAIGISPARYRLLGSRRKSPVQE